MKECCKNSVLAERKRILKVLVECRDKTDVWADGERWNKFEKMFRKELKQQINSPHEEKTK